jgi:hypothetical protein
MSVHTGRSAFTKPLFNRPDIPMELKDFEERDIKWLYMFLTGKQPDEKYNDLVGFIIEALKYPDIRVCEKIYDLKFIEIRELRSINVLSDIAWIQRDDHRLLIWLLTVLRHTKKPDRNFILSERINVGSISTERRYSRVIEYIDAVFFDEHASDKKDWLADLKVEWTKSKTPDSEVQWIESENIDQLTWAWGYLKEKRCDAILATPVTPDEYYHAVLASLDCMCIGERNTKAEKELFLIKFRKAWSQKKFRAAGKIKKSYHLPLTVKAKESLEKLAMVKNCTENEILESLIHREYVEICLDAQGNPKY